MFPRKRPTFTARTLRTAPVTLAGRPGSAALIIVAVVAVAMGSGASVGQPASQPSASAPPSGSASSQPHSHSHAQHSFSDTERYVKMFEDPSRAAWQKPAKVVSALKLSRGQAVADIGAGSGYFSLPLARAVGSSGKVYAVDIEPGMITHIEERARKEGVRNLVPVLAERDDAKLAPGSIDLVFICDTWHHIDDRVSYLRKLRAALRPGARIAIVDYQDRPLPVGPPPEAKISRDGVIGEFRAAGYELAKEHTFLPYQYFLIFTPAGT